MSAYDQSFIFRTINGNMVVFNMNPHQFNEFQSRIMSQNYFICYFGKLYPFVDNNNTVCLTYEEYMRESSLLVDKTQTRNCQQLERDILAIVEQINAQ